MGLREVPAELRDLIRRVAAHPGGLEFLRVGYLESVAVSLRVHPFVVDAARAYLETPAGEAYITHQVCKEMQRHEAPHRPSRATAHLAAQHMEEIERVVSAAEGHPLGTKLLLETPLETASKELGAHPFLVLRAQGLVRRTHHLY
jgi:hypothetical protein